MTKLEKINLKEVFVPSSQIVPKYDVGGKQMMITPFQHDAMNFICFEAQRQISTKYKLTETKEISRSDDLKIEQIKKFVTIDSEQDVYNFLRNQIITIELDELISFTQKYKSHNRTEMSKALEKLQDIKVTVNQLRPDSLSKKVEKSRFPLITRITRITNSKKIEVRLEHELLLGWIFEAIPFNKMILKMQTYLTTMYTKTLYAILSDNAYRKTYETDFESLKTILFIDAPNFSKLKGNYLNKSIKEINEKTDITINNISSVKSKGITTITFDFIKEEMESIELSVEDQILMNKATHHYDILPQFRKEKIKDKVAYIDSIYKKDYDKLKDELIIDNFIKDNIFRTNDQPQTLALINKNEDYFSINDKYQIMNLDTNNQHTSNATETIKFIEKLIVVTYDFEMVELGINQEFSRSSVNF